MNLATTCANNSTWNAKYNAYKAHADSVNKFYIDSMENINRIALAKADVQKAKADSLTRVINRMNWLMTKLDADNTALNDSIDKLLADTTPGQPINPLVCQMCLRARIGMQAEIDSFKIQVGNLERRDTTRLITIALDSVVIANRQLEIDTLRRTIRNWPKPQSPPRLFGIFKVTPTQSFLGGTLTGLLLVLVVPKL